MGSQLSSSKSSGKQHRQIYESADAQAILAAIPHNPAEPGGEILRWHPLLELDGEEAPDPLKNPHLPFPFSASQLAAFMLDGSGLFVQEPFGHWRDGPDERKLANLNPHARDARQALREAYAAYRAAESRVGPLGTELADRAKQLSQQYQAANKAANERENLHEEDISGDEYSRRRAQAKNSVEQLSAEESAVREEADAHYRDWRRRMVGELWTTVAAVPESLKPRQRLPTQEQAILAELRRLSHDPKAIPGPDGKAGIKKARPRGGLRSLRSGLQRGFPSGFQQGVAAAA